jgi:hypothetical protein
VAAFARREERPRRRSTAATNAAEPNYGDTPAFIELRLDASSSRQSRWAARLSMSP